MKKFIDLSFMKELMNKTKHLPLSTSKAIIDVFSSKSDEKRIEVLKKLPENMLDKFLEASTYFLLKSGLLATEAVEKIIPKEVKTFVNAVKDEVMIAGEVTVEAVRNAIKKVKQMFGVAVFIAVICFAVFLIINPPAAGVLIGLSFFLDVFTLSGPIDFNKKKK